METIMRMFGYPIYLLYLYVVLTGCASPKSVTSTTNTAYTEDLSVWRPKTEPLITDTTVPVEDGRKQTTYLEPRHAVNQKLDVILDSIDRINLSRKFIEGYTIQVYVGKREEALSTKRQLNGVLPGLDTEIQFAEPIFRLKAGKYYHRLDAQKDYAEIKRHFPAAIIIPDKIPIN